jgi:hypothetical protein
MLSLQKKTCGRHKEIFLHGWLPIEIRQRKVRQVLGEKV